MALLYLVAIFAVVFAAIRRVKFAVAPARRGLTPLDVGMIVGWPVVFVLLAGLGWFGAVIGALLGGAVLGLVWFDALLYRLFSFELGGGGVKGVVYSSLYAEVAKMEVARSFFRRHALWTLLPALGVGLPLAAVWLPTAWAAAVVAPFLLAILWQAGGFCRPSRGGGLVVDLYTDRRPRPGPLELTAEEAQMLVRVPAPYRASAQHGQLVGRSVVVLSFESVARTHLRAFEPGGAHAPFFESQIGAALTTRHSFCTAPLTNVAHLGWYRGQDIGVGPGYLAALTAAGYTCAYLTPETAEHYGLGQLLERAGFDPIVDGAVIARHTGRPAADSDLPAALSRLFPSLKQPFYLHVHLANAHIPYRVEDPARYARFDPCTDRGRFLNAVEEADGVLGALWRLVENADSEVPILVLTSDHGQSFGEKGYWSHASGLVAEQLDVPFFLRHPDLPPDTLPMSTHHDLLPTVLDLLGIRSDHAGWGDSLFHADRRADSLLWDGASTRPTPGVLGHLRANDKVALDLVRDTCIVSGWCDEDPRPLVGAERVRAEAFLARLVSARGAR